MFKKEGDLTGLFLCYQKTDVLQEGGRQESLSGQEEEV